MILFHLSHIWLERIITTNLRKKWYKIMKNRKTNKWSFWSNHIFVIWIHTSNGLISVWFKNIRILEYYMYNSYSVSKKPVVMYFIFLVKILLISAFVNRLDYIDWWIHVIMIISAILFASITAPSLVWYRFD